MFQYINLQRLSSLVIALKKEEFVQLSKKMCLALKNRDSESLCSEVWEYLKKLQETYGFSVLAQSEDSKAAMDVSLLIMADLALVLEELEEVRMERQQNHGSKD